VCELGEDGDQFLVDGHPEDAAVLAAINAYAKSMWGDDFEHTLDNVEIRSQWVAFRPHRDGCDDDACEPCREGRHDDCAGDCECGVEDHEWFCSCDEYLWFTDQKSTKDLIANPDPAYHAVTVVDR
jgi:hypothetical protein